MVDRTAEGLSADGSSADTEASEAPMSLGLA
jgi:hypothetical protein